MKREAPKRESPGLNAFVRGTLYAAFVLGITLALIFLCLTVTIGVGALLAAVSAAGFCFVVGFMLAILTTLDSILALLEAIREQLLSELWSQPAAIAEAMRAAAIAAKQAKPPAPAPAPGTGP